LQQTQDVRRSVHS